MATDLPDAMPDASGVNEEEFDDLLLRYISEAKEAKKQLLESRKNFTNIVERSADGILVIDTDGIIRYANPAASLFLGKSVGELVGSPFGYEAVPGQSVDLELSFPGMENSKAEMKVADTEWQGTPAHLATLRDISARKKAENRLRKAKEELEAANQRLTSISTLDPLTDLLNRRGLEAALTEEIERSRRNSSQVVCVLLDLDDFKRVNDTLGYAVGDAVLRQVSERIRQATRTTDRIGRIGGDEFLLLLPDIRVAEGMLVAEKLRLSLASSPLVIDMESTRLTASFSAVPVPYDTCSIEELLAISQAAIRMSKKKGKNRVTSFESPSSVPPNATSSQLDIHKVASDPDMIRTVSQKILNLKSGQTVGYELLARGPKGPFESPVDLFRLARENHLLSLLDLNCLRACIEGSRKLLQGFRYHLNLCPSTLLDTPVERLMDLFPGTRQDRSSFCLELSEQQFIGDPIHFRDHVLALKDAGIRIALDDMGFGRSSVEALIVLEPEIVKIDRRYIHMASENPGKERSLRRLVQVLKALGVDIVAEGIETEEDLELLKEMGVEYGQGYLWGRPG